MRKMTNPIRVMVSRTEKMTYLRYREDMAGTSQARGPMATSGHAREG